MWLALGLASALLVAALLLAAAQVDLDLALNRTDRSLTVALAGVRLDVDLGGGTASVSAWGLRLWSSAPERDRSALRRSKHKTVLGEAMWASAEPLVRFVVGVVKAARVHALWLHLSGGLGDPDSTGRAFGVIQAVRGALPRLGRAITFAPDFASPALTAEGRVWLSFRFGRLLALGAVLLLRLPWRVWLRLWQAERAAAARAGTTSKRIESHGR
jgi:hypothetical protein